MLKGENDGEVQEEKIIQNFDLKVNVKKPEKVKSENVSTLLDTQISLTDATAKNL